MGRLTKVERALLENQRAILFALTHVVERGVLTAMLMQRFDATGELTAEPPEKS